MPSEALLLGIAQIAVVIAGFTAVTSALTPPDGAWSPGHRILQRAIVSTSFNVMFEALLPLIGFAWLGDVRAALTVSGAAAALWVGWVIGIRMRQLYRAGAFRTRRVQLLFAASVAAEALFVATALGIGSVAAYSLALCFQLLNAIVSFYTLIAATSS